MTDINPLLTLMARLRDPAGGCPWDLRQDFASVAPYTLEEAYEVLDAIEQGDMDELRDELGDLLFQVVFHAQMAKELGAFDFDDVVTAITRKMIRRHPHVFADVEHADEAALRHAWEAEKQREREAKGGSDAPSSQMDGVARALPALVRAEKLQKRAARVGFDWSDAGGALAKCHEEFAELEEAIASSDRAHEAEELGDLLFAMVNVARLLGYDAERLMRQANDKFEGRFRAMEQLLRERGGPAMPSLTLDQLEGLWQSIKDREAVAGKSPL